MIEARNIYKSFNNVEVLKDVSLIVNDGEVVTIIGPSGSGKSTILRCINRLVKVDKGEIVIDGKELTSKKSDIRFVRRNLGMVFQSFNLYPHLNAYQNIALGPKLVLKMQKNEINDIVEDLLSKVGLLDKKFSYPSQLSGGQQQRIAIARALAMRPKAMLFDEPTSALDPELIGEVLVVIKRLAKDGMTMTIVTHEMNFARDISEKVYVMAEGQIIEQGTANEIFRAPKNVRTQSFLKSVIERN